MATFDLFRNKNTSKAQETEQTQKETVPLQLCIKYGVLVSILLIVNFLTFCVFTNLLGVHELGVVNMFLLSIGIFFTIHHMSVTSRDERVDYMEGFKAGILTSLVTILIHAFFVLIYSSLDPSIIESALNNAHGYKNSLSFAGVVIFEGLAASFITTYCLMQYFKRDET